MSILPNVFQSGNIITINGVNELKELKNGDYIILSGGELWDDFEALFGAGSFLVINDKKKHILGWNKMLSKYDNFRLNEITSIQPKPLSLLKL